MAVKKSELYSSLWVSFGSLCGGMGSPIQGLHPYLLFIKNINEF